MFLLTTFTVICYVIRKGTWQVPFLFGRDGVKSSFQGHLLAFIAVLI